MTDRSPQPVSTRVSRTVPAAKVAQFEALLHEVIIAARKLRAISESTCYVPRSGGVY